MESNSKDDSKVRKLASVQVITEIKKITESKNLSLAKVLGWHVVVQDNTFTVGDKVIFFEIDSLLPSDAQWAQIMKQSKYRVKSKEFFGSLSQGFALSLSILSKDNTEVINPDDYPIDMDLTQQLKIINYDDNADEPQIKLPKGKGKNASQLIAGSEIPYPIHLIEKSDEPRIQSFPNFIEDFKGKQFYSTLKYDGTSSTFSIDTSNNNYFYICSRNKVRGYIKDDIYTEIAIKYQIKEKLEKVNYQYIIQGEIYGPKIQKNNLKAQDNKIVIFCIKDLVKNYYLGMEEMIDVCKALDLPMVEIVEVGDSFNYTLDELIEKSKGIYPGTNIPREGLVYRLQKNWNTEEKRYSFKVINNDYLLLKK